MQEHPTPELIRDYTAALMQSAAQLSLILEQMAVFSEAHPNPHAKPIPVVLSELVEGIVADNLGRFEPGDVKLATRLLGQTTEAIGNDLFFVDPALVEEHGIPDLN